MRSVVHRWVRQPNLHSDIWNRVANRFDPLKHTSLFCKIQTPIENCGSSEPPIHPLHSLTEPKDSLIKSTPALSTFKPLPFGGAMLNIPPYHLSSN